MKVTITSTLVSIGMSVMLSLGTAVWATSSKSHDIETNKSHIKILQEDAKVLSKEVGGQGAILNRLDERTIIILELIKRTK